mgnify:FL=1
MVDLGKTYVAIKKQVEEISIRLMQLENKNFCLAHISPVYWRIVSYKDTQENEHFFVIVPSIAFNRFILEREYLHVVEQFPECFEKKDDWLIVRALKEYDKLKLVREYTDEEFLEYIMGETMAYVFKVEQNGSISNRILRLDLCRGINKSNTFQGGIFHVLKHFTVNGYPTLSSNTTEYYVETWSEIYKYVILNFFVGTIENDNRDNYYVAKSYLKDGHILRGVYYKEDNIPVSFISSIRIDNSLKKR